MIAIIDLFAVGAYACFRYQQYKDIKKSRLYLTRDYIVKKKRKIDLTERYINSKSLLVLYFRELGKINIHKATHSAPLAVGSFSSESLTLYDIKRDTSYFAEAGNECILLVIEKEGKDKIVLCFSSASFDFKPDNFRCKGGKYYIN